MGRVAPKGSGGARGAQGVTNHVHDGVDILMHRTGREAQGSEAFVTQNLVAKIVAQGLIAFLVVGSINLDG